MKGFLASPGAASCFRPPEVKVDGLHPAALQLVHASVLDDTCTAMPFPVFAAKGWLVESITSFSPFGRLGLWVAYMEVRVHATRSAVVRGCGAWCRRQKGLRHPCTPTLFPATPHLCLAPRGLQGVT